MNVAAFHVWYLIANSIHHIEALTPLAYTNTLLGGYIALSTMLGQMIGSCISGILESLYPRKNILIASLLLGSAACVLFGVIRYYPVLLLLRVVTGGCQGAIVPVLFSLIGDFYSVEERATYSAIVSSCLGGGMMLGQLFTGYTLGEEWEQGEEERRGILLLESCRVTTCSAMTPIQWNYTVSRGNLEEILATDTFVHDRYLLSCRSFISYLAIIFAIGP